MAPCDPVWPSAYWSVGSVGGVKGYRKCLTVIQHHFIARYRKLAVDLHGLMLTHELHPRFLCQTWKNLRNLALIDMKSDEVHELVSPFVNVEQGDEDMMPVICH